MANKAAFTTNPVLRQNPKGFTVFANVRSLRDVIGSRSMIPTALTIKLSRLNFSRWRGLWLIHLCGLQRQSLETTRDLSENE